MQICKVQISKIEPAIALCKEVFMEFEAPEYDEMGIKTFLHFISRENTSTMIERGEMTMFACYDGSEIVGVSASRMINHVSLLFVKTTYHRRGIGRALLSKLADDILTKHEEKDFLSVNASPYGVEFYKKVGFVPMSEEQLRDGIRFTPMKWKLK